MLTMNSFTIFFSVSTNSKPLLAHRMFLMSLIWPSKKGIIFWVHLSRSTKFQEPTTMFILQYLYLYMLITLPGLLFGAWIHCLILIHQQGS